MQRCNLYGFVLCVLCVWLVFSISICMRLGCMPAAFSFIAHQANVGEKNKNPNITQTMPHKCSSKKHQSPPSVTERYSFLFLLLFFFLCVIRLGSSFIPIVHFYLLSSCSNGFINIDFVQEAQRHIMCIRLADELPWWRRHFRCNYVRSRMSNICRLTEHGDSLNLRMQSNAVFFLLFLTSSCAFVHYGNDFDESVGRETSSFSGKYIENYMLQCTAGRWALSQCRCWMTHIPGREAGRVTWTRHLFMDDPERSDRIEGSFSAILCIGRFEWKPRIKSDVDDVYICPM